MEEEKIVEVTDIKSTKGKTYFGKTGLRNPTPMWATWIFRTEFVINKAVLMILGASSAFTPEQVKESIVWIAAIDYAVWQIAKFIGVKKEDFN